MSDMFVLDQSLFIKLYDNLVPNGKLKGNNMLNRLFIILSVNIDLSKTTNHAKINDSLL